MVMCLVYGPLICRKGFNYDSLTKIKDQCIFKLKNRNTSFSLDMRRVIACQNCRNRKVKCVHDNGIPPCRACAASGKEKECKLSYPSVNASSKRKKLKFVSMNRDEPRNEPRKTPMDPKVENLINENNDFLEIIPDSTIYKACELVSRNFKELFFLHEPTLLFDTKNINPYLKSIILALCGSYTPIPDDPFLSSDCRFVKNEVYYKYVTSKLLSPMGLITKPNLNIIQSLIMLALYDWGKDRYYSSWIVHGISCRMLQTFGLFSTTSIDESIKNCKKIGVTQLNCELLIRTYWSCFMVDRIIDSGKNRSICFEKSNYLNVHLPSSEENFLLMSHNLEANIQSFSLKEFEKVTLGYQNRGAAYLVSVFEIWGRISDFLLLGGRTVFKIPPFEQNSFSTSIKTDLAKWYECLPEHWKWSSDRYKAHSIMKSEVTFVLINVLYHLCHLYINREYIPFLPHSNDFPVGPVEEPLLPPAPENYWINSAKELFGSTRKLCKIFLQIIESEETCYTFASPFFLFCIFSALATGFYGTYFTWMDPDYENDLGEMSTRLLNYLESKNVSATISANWCKTAHQLIDLYDAVAKDRGKARELKLGRYSFDNLEDSIQIVNVSEKLLPENYSGDSRQDKILEYANGVNRDISNNFPPNILDFFLLSNDEASQEYFDKIMKDLGSWTEGT